MTGSTKRIHQGDFSRLSKDIVRACSATYQWLLTGQRRQNVLLAFTQPLAVKQIALKLGMALRAVSYALWELEVYGLVLCLNSGASKGRVYWMTDSGLDCQKQLCVDRGVTPFAHHLPDIPWDVYGWVCTKYGMTVLKELDDQPWKAVAIRRRIKFRWTDVRISANNTRDVLYQFVEKGIVERVFLRKKAHVHYRLTPLGRELQQHVAPTDKRRCRSWMHRCSTFPDCGVNT